MLAMPGGIWVCVMLSVGGTLSMVLPVLCEWAWWLDAYSWCVSEAKLCAVSCSGCWSLRSANEEGKHCRNVSLKCHLKCRRGRTDAHYASGCGSGSAYQHVGLSATGRRTLILKHTTDGYCAPPLCQYWPACYQLPGTANFRRCHNAVTVWEPLAKGNASKVFAPVPRRPRMCVALTSAAWTMQQGFPLANLPAAAPVNAIIYQKVYLLTQRRH